MKKTVLQSAIVLAMAVAFWPLVNIPGAMAYERQSNNQNGVRVDVVPLQLEIGKPASFQIRLNTHSVDLNQDLAEVSYLKTGSSKVLEPEVWKGSAAGGHHRSGVLHFARLPADADEIVLTIRDIADVPERMFRWKLK